MLYFVSLKKYLLPFHFPSNNNSLILKTPLRQFTANPLYKWAKGKLNILEGKKV